MVNSEFHALLDGESGGVFKVCDETLRVAVLDVGKKFIWDATVPSPGSYTGRPAVRMNENGCRL